MSAPVLDDRPIPVFPAYPNKRPACANGFRDASADPAAIAALWRGRSGLLIAVPTGAPSGFDVLDIDPGGLPWFRAAGLPATRMHETPRGLHLLFQHAAGVRCSAGVIAPGVDVRGEGGYIIWWPAEGYTVRNEGLLAEWPFSPEQDDRIAPMVTSQSRLPRPTSLYTESARWARIKQTAARWSREETFALYACNKAFQRISAAPKGQRNHTLNGEGYALGRLIARGWCSGDAAFWALWHGADQCGYVRDHGEKETLAAIRHALLDGMARPYPDSAAGGGDHQSIQRGAA